MRQRGRKSIAQLAINNVDGSPSRLATPKGLNVTERAEFERLINSTDPRHFRESDTAMVVAYTQAVILSRKLGRSPDRIKEWEVATRTLMALARSLRLTVQSRADAKTITRQDSSHVPWDVAEKLGWHENKEEWARMQRLRHPMSGEYDDGDNE